MKQLSNVKPDLIRIFLRLPKLGVYFKHQRLLKSHSLSYIERLLELSTDRTTLKETLNVSIEDVEGALTHAPFDRVLYDLFVQYGSIKDSLIALIELYKLRAYHLHQWLSAWLYPIFLWLSSLSILTLIYSVFIPKAYVQLNLELSLYFYLIQFILGVEWGLILLTLLGMRLLKSNLIRLYIWSYRRNYLTFWRSWLSLNFVIHLKHSLRFGIQIQTLSKHLKHAPHSLHALIHQHIYQALSFGKPSKELFDWLDPHLMMMLQIYDVEHSMYERLTNHQTLLIERLSYESNQVLSYFKLFVYVQVCVFILSVYQLSFSPLTYLEKWL